MAVRADLPLGPWAEAAHDEWTGFRGRIYARTPDSACFIRSRSGTTSDRDQAPPSRPISEYELTLRAEAPEQGKNAAGGKVRHKVMSMEGDCARYGSFTLNCGTSRRGVAARLSANTGLIHRDNWCPFESQASPQLFYLHLAPERLGSRPYRARSPDTEAALCPHRARAAGSVRSR
jgi:hypothetical protein